MTGPYSALIVAIALLGSWGCAANRPVLYPNATLQQRGDAQAQRDIDACMDFAKAHGAANEHANRIARTTAERGAAGGAAGAVGGAIAGSAGRGAAIGAASAATWGLVAGLFRTDAPDPLFRSFVNSCLQDRGYRPVGWK
jgi:hypothetical protein